MSQAVADVASWNDKIALLQTELAQANLSLTQTQNNFPASAQTIEYNETLMGLASSCNLTMQILVATQPTAASLNTSDFTFYSNVFTISVMGKVSDILNFVDKIATNGSFKTGAMTPISFTIPEPLTQAQKDQMRSDIQTQMISAEDASIQGADRVKLIENALYLLLGGKANPPAAGDITQAINSLITSQFNSSIADMMSNDIAQAIENGLANTLVSTVATQYTNAIMALFTDQINAGLLPTFTGFAGSLGSTPLDTLITAAIQGIPPSTMPAAINQAITDALNSNVSDQIAAMVNDSDVDATLAAQVTAAEMPSAQLTVAVYSYKGD
jgi:hypothetical protein